jgi:FixJ family two-component response regulator
MLKGEPQPPESVLPSVVVDRMEGITGHGDIPMSVRAMKAGAVEFLTQPFRDQALLDAIHQAIQRDRANRKNQAELSEQRARYGC